MAFININGFEFLDSPMADGGYPFVLKGISIDEELNYIKKNKIKSVYLSHFTSKNVKDLSFLKEIDFLEYVNINELDVDYLDIYSLNALKYLVVSVNRKNQQIDFSVFNKLEYLAADWFHDFPDMSNNSKLYGLALWKYNPKSKCLSDLKMPKQLTNLAINSSNIESIKGLQPVELKTFEMSHCSTLYSLRDLKNVSNSLESLTLESCRKLEDYSDLHDCKNIKKLILSKCGPLPSISWVCGMPNLKMFTFRDTDVLDGDISCCENLEYVSFDNKKHYSHKLENIRNLIAAKGKI